ncbi:dTDP-4-dehydrorhamnose 3,5-epimerase family protein [Cyanobium sp. NIES-981]|uniref:dTDP-4-dehydrorhamnose 3,5-epimerase family protein n=1 Tax=Cyanobium sp. NIES-981 TaxID=1851505 RepID=UPI001CEC1A9D|nr:dTDP-4-dehydrorhamnose 3,5-epimerase [Cyanobium sp. NIES-981]
MAIQALATPLHGLIELRSAAFTDGRGSFHNVFRREDYAPWWGERPVHQINISCTKRVGAIRGLHTQLGPTPEAKLVRCLRGRVFDVAVDLREDSPSRGRWHALELSPQDGNAWLIPEGCLHGFQVLEPGSQLLYVHSAPYRPEDQVGVVWNDPYLAIGWPLPAVDLSRRDEQLPRLAALCPPLHWL